MAYAVFSVVANEQPSASKWNILGSNDASFNDGTGIGNNAIIPTHLNSTNGNSTWAWVSFTPTMGGFSVNPTRQCWYTVIGKTCIAQYDCLAGTSNATSLTATLPITASSSTTTYDGYLRAQDSGSFNVGLYEFTQSATTLTAYKDVTGAAWTGSGTKGFRATVIYQI